MATGSLWDVINPAPRVAPNGGGPAYRLGPDGKYYPVDVSGGNGPYTLPMRRGRSYAEEPGPSVFNHSDMPPYYQQDPSIPDVPPPQGTGWNDAMNERGIGVNPMHDDPFNRMSTAAGHSPTPQWQQPGTGWYNGATRPEDMGGGQSPAVAAAGSGESPFDKIISGLANGETDVGAALQKGSDAADSVAHPEAEAIAGMSPAMQHFMDLLSEADKPGQYAGYTEDVLKELMKQGEGSHDTGMALAKAGFTMAGSKSPYFFGALGEGGVAGLEDYEKSQQNALEARVKAATLAEAAQRSADDRKQNRLQGYGTAANIEQDASAAAATNSLGRAQLAQSATDAAAQRGLTQQQINISSASAQVAAQEARFAQQKYEDTRELVKQGLATEIDLKNVQIELENARVNATKLTAEARKLTAEAAMVRARNPSSWASNTGEMTADQFARGLETAKTNAFNEFLFGGDPTGTFADSGSYVANAEQEYREMYGPYVKKAIRGIGGLSPANAAAGRPGVAPPAGGPAPGAPDPALADMPPGTTFYGVDPNTGERLYNLLDGRVITPRQ